TMGAGTTWTPSAAHPRSALPAAAAASRAPVSTADRSGVSNFSTRLLTTPVRLDLAEFQQRLLEVVIEQPHRVKNFTQGCRRSGPVVFPKGEDAVVAQVSHDRRIGDLVFE